MSREQRVRDLIAKWQPRLRLQAWDIRYVDEKLPDLTTDTSLACGYIMGYNQQAQLWIDPKAPDADLEALVLHELGHIVLFYLSELVTDMADKLGGKANEVLNAQAHGMIEVAADSYAFAITGRQPLFGKTVKRHRLTAWGYKPKAKK